jgi:peroxin-19
VLSDDFAKQLAAEMEAMLLAMSGESGPLGSEPQTESDTQAQDTAFREAWNKMIIQDLEGDGKGNGLGTLLGRRDDTEDDAHTTEQKKHSGDEKQKMPEAEDPFQKAIRQAMEKLQDSDDTLKVRCLNIDICLKS